MSGDERVRPAPWSPAVGWSGPGLSRHARDDEDPAPADDDDAQLVRLYTVTRGRVGATESYDLLAYVVTNRDTRDRWQRLQPEQRAILALGEAGTGRTVADIAADIDLPLGVIR